MIKATIPKTETGFSSSGGGKKRKRKLLWWCQPKTLSSNRSSRTSGWRRSKSTLVCWSLFSVCFCLFLMQQKCSVYFLLLWIHISDLWAEISKFIAEGQLETARLIDTPSTHTLLSGHISVCLPFLNAFKFCSVSSVVLWLNAFIYSLDNFFFFFLKQHFTQRSFGA